MPSSKEYLNYILEQLSDLDEITYRAMMRAFLIYYRGKLVGGIYNDRLLIKPVKSAISYMPRQFIVCLMKVQRKCCWWITWTIKYI